MARRPREASLEDAHNRISPIRSTTYHGVTEQLLSGRLARTEWRPLSKPAIPDSPQAAGPAVPESDIGAGGVPGCSGMPGAWKWQRAVKLADSGGSVTVERHGGFDVVMEKIVPWEQENPVSNGRDMIDDFRLWGSLRCRQMGVLLSDQGGHLRVT